jgi:hypothetical protein
MPAEDPKPVIHSSRFYLGFPYAMSGVKRKNTGHHYQHRYQSNQNFRKNCRKTGHQNKQAAGNIILKMLHEHHLLYTLIIAHNKLDKYVT